MAIPSICWEGDFEKSSNRRIGVMTIRSVCWLKMESSLLLVKLAKFAAGMFSVVWGLTHLGLGFTFGLTASLLGKGGKAGFLSAGFLIDGVLILIFCVAIIARWSGAPLMGVTAFGLSIVLGVGMGLISPSSSWWPPFVVVGSLYLSVLGLWVIRSWRLRPGAVRSV